MKEGPKEKFTAQEQPEVSGEESIIENEEVKELELPCLEVVYKLRDRIEKSEYGTIVGDDASGRIPTLIVGNAIGKIYEKNGNESPQILFLAGGGGKEKVEEIVDYLKEISARGKFDAGRRVLLVTDYLVTGSSIEPILSAFRKMGIESDVASTFSTKGEKYWNNFLNTRVVIGAGEAEPGIYGRHNLSGVHKISEEVIARSFKKRMTSESVSDKIQGDINQARKDANSVVDSVVDYYEKRLEDDRNFSAENNR
jgi:adenine/guanine phosphoribosyltransferase-like PRPP-binding protein